MSERPFHVRVAEAIGWTKCRLDHADVWIGMAPGHNDYAYSVPHYDTDWSATGPLIERLQITLCSPYADGRAHDYDEAKQGVPPWEAAVPDIQREGRTWERGLYMSGATALVAVCNLILALHAAGKLPKVSAC